MLDSLEDTPQLWCDAASAAALGRAPLAVEVAGWPLVLFRDEAGRPAALLDRCPHRGVPLSLGSCKDGLIRCLYHGWAFDAEGRCQDVPASLEPVAPRQLLAPYPVTERDGRIWVAVPGPA